MITLVSVASLRETIQRNRDEHVALFEQACERYHEEALAWLSTRMEEIRAGVKTRPTRVYFNLPMPEEHTDDYDRVLKMLELHTQDTIELNEHEVGQYVLNEWHWAATFAANTVSYASRRSGQVS